VISPDGKSIAFTASDAAGNGLLWIRRLDQMDAMALAGTDGASLPFWSPDGQSIGFFAHSKLKRIAVTGGPAQTIADAARPIGGAWNSAGTIIFSPEGWGPIFAVSSQGGQPRAITAIDMRRKDYAHQALSFLADGEHFLFFNNTLSGASGIYVGSLKTTETRLLLRGVTSAAATSDGFVMFVQDGVLKAQELGNDEPSLVGAAIPLAGGGVNRGLLFAGLGNISASAIGTLGYRLGTSTRRKLTWIDRSGKDLGTVGAPGNYDAPALSPDEKQMAVDIEGDIWIIDAMRQVMSQLTFDHASFYPAWSPDGRSIVYTSLAGEDRKLLRKAASGAGAEEVLVPQDAIGVTEWSRDGRFISYFSEHSANGGEDIEVLSVSGDRRSIPAIHTKFNEYENRLSPDAKWIAYVSEESGTPEVYVQTFPASDVRVHVSTAGGAQPMWRADGRELFYMGLDGRLMAVDVTAAPRFKAGVPHALFQINGRVLYCRNTYAPTADGQRFLVNSYVDDTSSVAVILNWHNLLKQ